MSKKEKLNVLNIDPSKIITVPISGTFYQRLNKFLVSFGDAVSKKELLTAMVKIRNETSAEDDFAYNLETLIILLHAVEIKFEEGGFTTSHDVEIEVPDDFGEEDPAAETDDED